MPVVASLILAMGMFAAPASSATGAEAGRLQAFEARYGLQRNGKPQGQSLLRLQALGEGRWELSMTIEADRGLAGLVAYRENERSLLQEDAGSWRVIEYQRERGSRFARRKEHARFDWSRQVATVLHEDQSLELPLEEGTTDPGSLSLRIAADLRAGRALDSYPVLRKGRLERWPFRVLRQEDLAGRPTTVVERVREHQRRSTISWLGADIGYLPVRIEQTEDDDRIVMSLESFEWLDEEG